MCVSETGTAARQKESWHAGHLIGWENEFGVAYDGMNFNKAHEACDTGQILSGESHFSFGLCAILSFWAWADASMPTDPFNATLAGYYM